MPTPYLDRDFALSEALQNPAVRGLADADDEVSIGVQIDVTAGTLADAKVYRPYYVAAQYLEQKRSQQALLEGGGAKFSNLATPIASLFRQQAALDAALGTVVPPGMESRDPDCNVCQGSLMQLRRRSTSISTTARP